MRIRGYLFGAALSGALALAASPAAAFCGFYVGGADTKLYNNATQVVLMRDGTRTVLTMQNNYEGPPANFAMVVPVPVVLQKENVKTLPREVFDKIDQLDAPRLVEYWEQDPCNPRRDHDEERSMPSAKMESVSDEGSSSRHRVKVEARFSVGEYDIVILSAQDSSGLDAWLREQRYAIPVGAEPFLRPYVQSGSKFFVAKVNIQKVAFERGMAMLSPLRFHYDSENFSLPVRLGLMNAKDAQDLIVHIIARGQRYEVANYPNVAIPTNFDVNENVRDNFGAFYSALFDTTVKKHPQAVVTEYSWAATTCDPCPGPALDPADFMTFGQDALPSEERGDEDDETPRKDWVLTRLHARYSRETLGSDLYFRAAVPIVGGREFVQKGGKPEQGAHIDSVNNFQGRYAIRHAWTGPIRCNNPVRGVWGGPPGGEDYQASAPKAARKLAFARRDMPLANFVAGDVPEVTYKNPAGPAPVEKPMGPRGCGSCAEGAGGNGLLMGLAAFLGAAVLRRRGRKSR